MDSCSTSSMSSKWMPCALDERPRGVVHHHADRRVRQLELARQRRLGHAGHADDVASIALEAVDLGRGLQARALRARIHAAIHRAVAGGANRREEAAAQGLVVGLGEVDVAHRGAAALEEGYCCAPRCSR